MDYLLGSVHSAGEPDIYGAAIKVHKCKSTQQCITSYANTIGLREEKKAMQIGKVLDVKIMQVSRV